MGQLTSSDGTPIGPKRFKQIVEECWYVSHYTNTSYTDVLDISFQERLYLIDCINQDSERNKKQLEAITAAANNNRK